MAAMLSVATLSTGSAATAIVAAANKDNVNAERKDIVVRVSVYIFFVIARNIQYFY